MKVLGNLEDLSQCLLATKLLMADPKHYRVEYAINPHMLDENGQVNEVDSPLAISQWLNLKREFETKGFPVEVIEARPELPDLVFTANQSLPLPDGRIVLSKMKSKERSLEVELVKLWYSDRGEKEFIQMENIFESMGDVLWHPGKKLLWGGHGFRTELSALEELHQKTEVPIIPLKLIKEEFYHLDTCFSLLDDSTLAYYPEAFEKEARIFIESYFERIITIDEFEALKNFAGNCYCPDGKHVFLHKGSEKFEKELRKLSFTPVPVDTSEFIKGGGSVFCMKLPLFL